MKLKAAARREVSARAAELAVDMFVDFTGGLPHCDLHPEDFLDLQEKLEGELYKEWG